MAILWSPIAVVSCNGPKSAPRVLKNEKGAETPQRAADSRWSGEVGGISLDIPEGGEAPPEPNAAPSVCPDFSGTYSDSIDRDVYRREWIFVQDGCRTITVFGRFFENGKSYVTEPRTEKLDGVWNQPCTTCAASMWKLEGEQLQLSVRGPLSDGCETRHVYELNTNGTDLSHRWGVVCPGTGGDLDHVERKERQVEKPVVMQIQRFEYVRDLPATPAGRLRWAKANAWNAVVEPSPSRTYLVPLEAAHSEILAPLASLDAASAYECHMKAEPVMDADEPRAFLIGELTDCVRR